MLTRWFITTGCALAVMALFGTRGTADASVTLVENGEATAVIVMPEDPASAEQDAADELVEHIELVSGATLEIVTNEDAVAGRTPVRLGSITDDALVAEIHEEGDDPWAFAMIVESDAISLRGLSPEGTRTAAYELLEQLGVRWYMPGEIGRVIPDASTLTLEVQRNVQSPSYEGRRGSRNHAEQWNERMRMRSVGRYGSHGMYPFHPSSAAREIYEDNPEYFALVNGERRTRQLCLTNSTDNIEENEVLQKVVDHYRAYLRENPDTEVINLGPNDGAGYCECDYCRDLDPPGHHTTPFATPEPSFTDRYVWFLNQMSDALADEFPDVRFGMYAYAQHLMPPVAVEPQDNLAISLAPIHVCRIHGPNNPVCPESNFPVWAYEQWRPYTGTYIADRGYLFHLAEPGFPFSLVHRVREEIPAFYEAGVRRWEPSPADAWASQNPSMYVVAKLVWDVDADVDAILEEFYDKFYGPASEPMGAFHELMDRTLRDADHHTGSMWDIPHIYTAEMRSEVRRYLEEAAGLAEGHDDAYATRIEIKTRALDFLDAYCDQRQLNKEFDFVGARDAMLRTAEIRDSLLEDFEYPMLYPRHADSLFRRFVERQGNEGYDTTGGEDSEIVARFDYEWKFQKDPERWGQYIGLHKPESEGGNWQTIRTDTSWSNQGLRYYFGQTWYRQTVDAPAEFEDETVNIWFDAVDNTAEVWVNGQFVGANHDGAEFDIDAFGSAFRPLQFDVTDAINFGGPNVVTVRSYRPRTNEVGTGGIMGPVMFYVPAPNNDE